MKKNLFNNKTIASFQLTGGSGNDSQIQFLGFHPIGDYTFLVWAPKDGENEYTDGAGNGVGLTTEQVELGIGRIEMDGDFNTIYTKFIDICTYKEVKAIIQNSDEFVKENTILYFIDGLDRVDAENVLDGLNVSDDWYIIGQLKEFCTNDPKIRIISHEEIEDEDAELIRFTFNGNSCVAVLYRDGTVLTPYDWQSSVWDDEDWTIEDSKWMNKYGNECVILNGLPRLF